MSDTPATRKRAAASPKEAPSAEQKASAPVLPAVAETPAKETPTKIAPEPDPAPAAPAKTVAANPEPAPAKVEAEPARKAKAVARAPKAKAVGKPAAPLPVAALRRTRRASPKPVVSKQAVKSVPNEKKPVSVAAAKPAPAQKGYVSMLNATETTKQAAEKVQSFFADANEKAKSAFEKSSKLGEEFAALAKGNVEALVESGKVAAKGAEALTQEAADYGKKSFEHASSTFKSMAAVKTPTELFQLQSEYAKSSFDSAVAEASKLSEAWMKLAGDMFQPLSNRYAVAAEKIKSAAL